MHDSPHAMGATDRTGAGTTGIAPPLPFLVVGRERELKDLKGRLGIGTHVRLEGDKLVSLRTQKGLSQRELAAKAGLSKRTIEDIESGRRTAHYRNTIDAIAAALEAEPLDLQRPVAAQVLTTVRGWPGVGKTTVAAALAHDAEVAVAFPDGVLWTSLGQTPDVFAELASWGRACGCMDVAQAHTVEELSGQLRARLRNQRWLLIVDDVWEASHATAFRIGGRCCATLITTRLRSVADELASTPGDVYKLDVLDDETALELLQTLTPAIVAERPEESLALVRELEGLPLAIQVAGRLLNAEASRGWGVGDLLRELREDADRLLQAGPPADMVDLVKETTPTVAALLKKSTDRLDPQTRQRFAMLAPFVPKPATFGLEAVAGVWQVEDAKPTIRTLVDRGLLEPIGDARFQMHALLVAHARALLQEGGDGR